METTTEGAPDPPPTRLRFTPRTPSGKDIIVLAPFDGIGAPHHIIQQLFGTPLLSISWEIDRACCKVMNARTPWVLQKGDITNKDAQSVVDLIGKADSCSEAIVVWTAAPPCQDFSRITDGPGHKGNGAACSSHPWSSCKTSNTSPRRGSSASCMRTSSCNPQWRQRSPTPWTSSPSSLARPISDGSIDPDGGTSADRTSNPTDPKDDGPLQWTRQGRWQRLERRPLNSNFFR